MGTPADPDEPDYPKGNGCVACTDAIFGGHTPEYVKFNIEGVEPCPPLPGLPDSFGSGILKQDGIDPCDWAAFFVRGGDFQDYRWRINLGGPVRSDCWYLIGDIPLFSSTDTAKCTAAFSNELNCGDGDPIFGGTVGITWGPGINQAAYDAQF